MKQRFITGMLIALIGLPLVLIPEIFIIFELVVLAGLVIAIVELYNMFKTRKTQPKWNLIVNIVFGILLYLSLIDLWGKGNETLGKFINLSFGFFPIILMAYTIVIMMGSVFDKNIDSQDTSNNFLVTNYVVLGLASFMLLRLEGIRYIVYLMLVVMSTDIFAYLFGMKFGKHKMAPAISPKKSWEGAIGGTVCATILGTLFGSLYGTMFNDALNPTILDKLVNMGDTHMVVKVLIIVVLSFFGSICGQIGDLVASKLKRHYGIKDYSQIFPGHGGVLDRFDSIIFTSIILVVLFSMIKIFLV